MNAPIKNEDYLMIRLPNFSKDDKKSLKELAKKNRMCAGAYVASLIEREMIREARKNADC